MLAERINKAWQARRASAPLRDRMSFAPEGLVLGAGTVLAPSQTGGDRPTIRLDEGEARLVVLLASAHLGPPTPRTLSHIRKAAERWGQGEEGLADIHLALSGAAKLDEPGQGAHRLFLADSLMEEGIEPEAILKALGLDPSILGSLVKNYQTQLRVPKGSGRPSGRWTRDGSGAAPQARLIPARYDRHGGEPASHALQMPVVKPAVSAPEFVAPAARSILGALTAEQLIQLGLYAARFAGPASALGVLFIPANKSLRVEGTIPGWPPIDYLWHRDQRSLTLSYLGPDWRRVGATAVLGQDGLFRDVGGKVIGRVTPNGDLVIDRSALLPQESRGKDEPTLCPKPVPDVRHGTRGVPFEDFMKPLINPGNPTPSGFGVRITDPVTGATAMFDDCQRRSGVLFDYKGVTYAHLLGLPYAGPRDGTMDDLIERARNQIAAAQEGQPIVWVFAEEGAAEIVRQRFKELDVKLTRIQIIHEYWHPNKK